MVQAAVVLDIHYTFVKYFSKAMATFSPNKKNTEKEMEKKNVCTKMMLEKNVCRRTFLIPHSGEVMVRP